MALRRATGRKQSTLCSDSASRVAMLAVEIAGRTEKVKGVKPQMNARIRLIGQALS
jgi:hypothetical protein